MITVRFFGTLRLQLNTASLQLSAQRVDELLIKVKEHYGDVIQTDIKNALIFVNGSSILELKRFKTELNDGDEVHILSPVGGG